MARVLNESDVRTAYARLRELTKELTPPFAKRAEIEAGVKTLNDFMRQNVHTNVPSNKLVEYADMALAEGHVELFEKVCDWCRIGNVKYESDLGPWKYCFLLLYRTINFRCSTSKQLANTLANSKQYIRAMTIMLHSIINNDQELIISLQNILNHINAAPAALGAFRRLYSLILYIYKTKACVLKYLLFFHRRASMPIKN